MVEYYSIGKISKECDVTIKTLRYYDKIKLLQPEYRDENSNYRYYTKKQMVDVLIIRRLRALNISIKNIKSIISKPSIENYINIIKKKSDELSSEIDHLQAKKAACDVILNRMINGKEIMEDGNDGISFGECTKNVKIEEIPVSRILYSRKIMKNYNNAAVSLDRWLDIYEQCTNNGISMQSSIITTYYAEPLAQFLLSDCDVEFGVSINIDTDLQKSNTNTRIAGGHKAYTAYHVGRYSEIIKSHVALIQWLHKENYEISGPISEVFVISPLDIEDEEKHITKIIIPIKERRMDTSIKK